MAPLIKVYTDMFTEVDKLLHYRFWDKQRERSNRAAGLAELAYGTRRKCPLRHQKLAYSGPPDDKIRCYVCIYCAAAASEPEIKDRGFDFWTIPDWEIDRILDLDLERQAKGSPSFHGGLGGEDFER